MPTRIPHHQVVVHRNGKNVRVPIGVPFEFTDDEVAQIGEFNERALRKPVNETRRRVAEPEVTSDLDEPEVTSDEDDPAPRKAAPRKAPRKVAPVTTDDDDEL